jgi:O-methyltransferase involved in polyketide biosynthesis
VQKGQSSRTAEYVALFRALETQRPVGRRLFADPLASAFLTRPLAAAAALARVPGIGAVVPWAIDRRVPGPLPSAVARTKVAAYLSERGWELVDDLSTTEALTRHGRTPAASPWPG